MFQRLNGKKGLILVALVTAILVGAYVAQYYTWTVHYAINPLTSFEVIQIPKTTGATHGTVFWEWPAELVAIGEGTAEWAGPDAGLFGLYSAKLSIKGGPASAAWVVIPYGDTLSSIDSISFWTFIETAPVSPTMSAPAGRVFWADGEPKDPGYPAPCIAFELDTDEDGKLDDWLALWHYGEDSKGTWVERSLEEGFHTSWGEGYGVKGETGKSYWHSVKNSGLATWDLPIPETYSALKLGTLEDWKGTTLGDAKVLNVEIAIGYWTFTELMEAYIDDITINDRLYPLDCYAEQIQVDKPLRVNFAVDPSEIEGLADDYFEISFSIKIYDKETGEHIGSLILPLIEGGDVSELVKTASETDGLKLIGSIPLVPGEYGVIKDVEYWTGAIVGHAEGSFTLFVFAEEVVG